jgi:hypothetical protein
MSGKPMITARNAFLVNDLPCKDWELAGLDLRPAAVDNHLWLS